jgi:hypothetical protein
MPPLVLVVDDCRAAYDNLRAKGVEFIHGTKSRRDSPLRGRVTGRTAIVDTTSSLLRQRLGPLFYRSSGYA